MMQLMEVYVGVSISAYLLTIEENIIEKKCILFTLINYNYV